MTKAKVKVPAKYWAIAGHGGWGEGVTIDKAVARAIKGGGSSKLDGVCVYVWELDPAYPVTHTSDSDGHAIHRPKTSVQGQMGRWSDERTPYMRGDDGKILAPKTYRYLRDALSDAGRHWDRYVD